MSVEDGPDAMADDSQEFVELPIFSLEPANRIIGSGQVSVGYDWFSSGDVEVHACRLT